MNNRRYFGLTNFSSWLIICLGVIILIVGIISMPMYYINGSWNLVNSYYKDTVLSTTPALVLTIIELIFSFIIIILGIITIKQKRILGGTFYFFAFFSLYFLVIFFIFLGIDFFNYFSIQTFAYPVYFVILAFIAISYWFEKRNIEVKLVSHKQNIQLQSLQSKEYNLLNNTIPTIANVKEEENSVKKTEKIVSKKTKKIIKEEPSLKFEFVKPTLNDKSEAEKVEIKKNWEKTAEKLNALKYMELKNIAEEKGIQISGSVKKIRLVDLLKKLLKFMLNVKTYQTVVR